MESKKIFFLGRIIFFLLALFISGKNVNAQCVWNNTSFIHRDGQQILDGKNHPIQLNGVNLGGWLMWEGWIWGGGFTSEKDIITNMQSLIGKAATDSFGDSIYNKFITREDILKISQECYNIVRIPINHTLLEDDYTPFVYKPKGWAVLDSLLQWCEDYNVYVLLDLHSAPGGQSTLFTADPDILINLWNGSVNQERTKKLWKAIAQRYKNRGIIAGYDLLNEPNVSDNSKLINLYKDIIDSIRSMDGNHMLHIEGNNYAQDFSMFSALLDSNMCFHFHFYSLVFNSTLEKNLQVFTNLSNLLNVPIWCGEWGENDISQIALTVKLFNDPAYKVRGNAFWTWKKMKQSLQYPYYAGIDLSSNWNKSISWLGNTSSPKPTEIELQSGISEFLSNASIPNYTLNASVSKILNRCSSTGINEIQKINQGKLNRISIEKNPKLNWVDQIENYELINSSGKLIWAGKDFKKNNISNFDNGIYFLRKSGTLNSRVFEN